MTSRLEGFFDDIRAVYAGGSGDEGIPDTTWLLGPEHISQHINWNRVVLWPTRAKVRPPTVIGQGRTTEEGGRDDAVFDRVVTLSIGLWCANYEQAEHRAHSMWIAIESVLSQAESELTAMTEDWIRADGDVTGGGALVILSFEMSFTVYSRDIDITAWDAALPGGDRPEIGEGVPTAEVETVQLTAVQQTGDDNEVIATVVINEGES